MEIHHDELADYPPECRLHGIVLPCFFVCSGPPGCEGEAGFTWRIQGLDAANGSLVWCGCDGQTQHVLFRERGGRLEAVTDRPRDRWRWYGSCEEPCEALYGSRADGFLYLDTFSPIDPACTECGEARWVEGRCLHPSVLALPPECCDCAGAALAADGRCRDGRAPDALELAPACCDCGGAMLVEGQCLSPEGLELPSPCCDCSDAWLDSDGSCRHVDGIELPAECCRCLDARLGADGITCVTWDADGNEVPAPADCCAPE